MKAEAFLLVVVALLSTCCSRVGGRLVRPVPGRVFDASARPPSGCQYNGALPDAVELPRARMLWRRVGADLTISGTSFDKGLLRAAGRRIMVGGGASVDARTGQQWEGAAEAGHSSRNVDFDASGDSVRVTRQNTSEAPARYGSTAGAARAGSGVPMRPALIGSTKDRHASCGSGPVSSTWIGVRSFRVLPLLLTRRG